MMMRSYGAPGDSVKKTIGARIEETSAEQLAWILKCLRGKAPFSEQRPDQLERIAKAMVHMEFAEGDHVCKEGEQGDAFYIIKSGTVGVSTAEHGQVATLEE